MIQILASETTRCLSSGVRRQITVTTRAALISHRTSQGKHVDLVQSMVRSSVLYPSNRVQLIMSFMWQLHDLAMLRPIHLNPAHVCLSVQHTCRHHLQVRGGTSGCPDLGTVDEYELVALHSLCKRLGTSTDRQFSSTRPTTYLSSGCAWILSKGRKHKAVGWDKRRRIKLCGETDLGMGPNPVELYSVYPPPSPHVETTTIEPARVHHWFGPSCISPATGPVRLPPKRAFSDGACSLCQRCHSIT